VGILFCSGFFPPTFFIPVPLLISAKATLYQSPPPSNSAAFFSKSVHIFKRSSAPFLTPIDLSSSFSLFTSLRYAPGLLFISSMTHFLFPLLPRTRGSPETEPSHNLFIFFSAVYCVPFPHDSPRYVDPYLPLSFFKSIASMVFLTDSAFREEDISLHSYLVLEILTRL